MLTGDFRLWRVPDSLFRLILYPRIADRTALDHCLIPIKSVETIQKTSFFIFLNKDFVFWSHPGIEFVGNIVGKNLIKPPNPRPLRRLNRLFV